MEERVEEARKEVLSSIARRSGNVSPDALVTSNEDGNGGGRSETTAWETEPEPEPDEAPEPEQHQEEDAIAEVVDEGSAPRWLLRMYGSPVVRGHALTDPEFDSLRIVVRIRADAPPDCCRPARFSRPRFLIGRSLDVLGDAVSTWVDNVFVARRANTVVQLMDRVLQLWVVLSTDKDLC